MVGLVGSQYLVESSPAFKLQKIDMTAKNTTVEGSAIP